MAFRPSDLQEAFFVPGTHAYRVWGYGTLDALEEVLRPGYFVGTLLRPGELIYVNARQRKKASGPAQEPGPGEVHMALLMVAKAAERAVGAPGPGLRLPGRRPLPNPDRGRAGACPGTGQARPRPPARQPQQAKRRASQRCW